MRLLGHRNGAQQVRTLRLLTNRRSGGHNCPPYACWSEVGQYRLPYATSNIVYAFYVTVRSISNGTPQTTICWSPTLSMSNGLALNLTASPRCNDSSSSF